MRERDDFVNGYLFSVMGMIVGLLCVFEAVLYTYYVEYFIPLGVVLFIVSYKINVAVWRDVSARSRYKLNLKNHPR
ncbi:MAG: hypothetical protein P1V97_21180 [Planctomycetota bacterium]|nr:hypothetical protein [Planctomycetota bacterium]